MKNELNFTREELAKTLTDGKVDEAFAAFVLDSYDDDRALEIESDTPEEFIAVCLEVYKDHDWPVPANG